jgi:RNA polymerase-binding transcription factor DksA
MSTPRATPSSTRRSASVLQPRQIQELNLALERERRRVRERVLANEEAGAPGSDADEERIAELVAQLERGGLGDWASRLVAEVAPESLPVVQAHADQARLAEVEAALRRLDTGEYGICERCGRAILAPRLRRRPWTRYCTRCAEEIALEGRLMAA